MKISSVHHWNRVSRLGSVWDSFLGLVLFGVILFGLGLLGMRFLSLFDSVLFVVQFGTKLAFCLG